MKIVMHKRASDEGEFAAPEDAAAWAAGAVVRWPDAEHIDIRVDRRPGARTTDPLVPGHFLYLAPDYWHASIEVFWSETMGTEPALSLDMTAVRDALEHARIHALPEVED